MWNIFGELVQEENLWKNKTAVLITRNGNVNNTRQAINVNKNSWFYIIYFLGVWQLLNKNSDVFIRVIIETTETFYLCIITVSKWKRQTTEEKLQHHSSMRKIFHGTEAKYFFVQISIQNKCSVWSTITTLTLT